MKNATTKFLLPLNLGYPPLRPRFFRQSPPHTARGGDKKLITLVFSCRLIKKNKHSFFFFLYRHRGGRRIYDPTTPRCRLRKKINFIYFYSPPILLINFLLYGFDRSLKLSKMSF